MRFIKMRKRRCNDCKKKIKRNEVRIMLYDPHKIYLCEECWNKSIEGY